MDRNTKILLTILALLVTCSICFLGTVLLLNSRTGQLIVSQVAPEVAATSAPRTNGRQQVAPTAPRSGNGQVAPTVRSGSGAETFNYVPGGGNYTFPENGSVESIGSDGWTRIRRAANGQYLAWTFFTRIRCDRPVGENLQWDSATKLEIFGPIQCRIELKRDFQWAQDLQREHPGDPLPQDPYIVANSKNSPLGLGWFVTGVGSVVVNGGAPVNISGPGVKQFGFPKEWRGTWVIDLNVPANGLVVLNQGEKLTPNDNWPLP